MILDLLTLAVWAAVLVTFVVGRLLVPDRTPTKSRESPRTDVYVIAGGLAMIGSAFLNLKYHVTGYLPGDVRGEQWFDPLVSLIAAVVGILMISFGGFRLIQALRHKQ